MDLGAGSLRAFFGWVEDGRLVWEELAREPNAPIRTNRGEEWDAARLIAFCRSAARMASSRAAEVTASIDSWGVDFAFVEGDPCLMAYRDESHTEEQKLQARQHESLFLRTGVQPQPFNTCFQLAARARRDPSCVGREWRQIPDWILWQLGARVAPEFTNTSTTGLMAPDGAWAEEAFFGWPAPLVAPVLPSRRVVAEAEGIRWVQGPGHDTAAAFIGMGTLDPGSVCLNVGSWALLGCLLPSPILRRDAFRLGWTNERAYDGAVRFLKNIPGFYILNRLHDELGIPAPMSEWLASADASAPRFDCLHESLYNPSSMPDAVRSLIPGEGLSESEWAGAGLHSLVGAVSASLSELASLAPGKTGSIRLAGGGSQSTAFCQALAAATGRRVLAGPAESAVAGSLAFQLTDDPLGLLDRSLELTEHLP